MLLSDFVISTRESRLVIDISRIIQLHFCFWWEAKMSTFSFYLFLVDIFDPRNSSLPWFFHNVSRLKSTSTLSLVTLTQYKFLLLLVFISFLLLMFPSILCFSKRLYLKSFSVLYSLLLFCLSLWNYISSLFISYCLFVFSTLMLLPPRKLQSPFYTQLGWGGMSFLQ